MARKSKKDDFYEQDMMEYYPQGPQPFFGPVPGIIPVAPPSHTIQLTPIIQPIAIVPYSNQQQSVASNDDDDE
ncbi:MAG TPA: hypothetical protein PKY53_02590 [Clostridia bacterium]|jgi:hypothetical protein|nr:hypothetical protein [Clostridia bacterium]